MRLQTPLPTTNADASIGSVGLSGWTTTTIDSLLGSGVLQPDDLDDLSARQLTDVAAAYVQAVAAAKPFNTARAIARARRGTNRARATA